MASSLARLALCPSQLLSLVCKILISLFGLSETNTIGYYARLWKSYLIEFMATLGPEPTGVATAAS
jgi:hypothetical protein